MDSRLNSALKFLLFIGAPVLFCGEHITSVQVAKFSVPLRPEGVSRRAANNRTEFDGESARGKAKTQP